MIVETATETYLFTCARCAARWIMSYEVRQVIDDEGAVRSFYRLHGTPCEAPAGEIVSCPNCRSSRVRMDPLYGASPVVDPAALVVPGDGVPAQRGPAEEVPVRRRVGGTWRRFKFSAVVTLDKAGRSRAQYPSGTPGLLVRVPSRQRPTSLQYFPAVIYTDDDRPLRPGDKGVGVIVSVPDDDAANFFGSGQHFAVWDGMDIGHGTVAYRLFLRWR